MKNFKPLLVLSVIFLTTFSSLIYEVVWAREISHVLGTSALAIATVLSAFMAGLALGSLFGGRIIDRVKNKYNFLAYLELGIGVSCLATLYLFGIIKYPYLAIHDILGSHSLVFLIVQFLLCFAVLIIPTFLIGIAFPTAVKLYYNEKRLLGKSVGSVYFADTIGGALGALLSGMILIAIIGFFKVSLMASLINVLCGAVLIYFFRNRGFIGSEDVPVSKKKRRTRVSKKTRRRQVTQQKISTNLILFLFFCSGFAALMFEVIWERYIALIYGTSIFSFSIILASFLSGLGIGSWAAGRYIERIKDKISFFAFIELMIGVSGAMLVMVFPYLERAFLDIYFAVDSYLLFTISLLIICFFVLLIPTILMGATLPVISAIYASEKKIGADVGKLYSVNSFGGIFGSFLAGFFIIPWIGLGLSSFFAAAIYIGIAVLFIYFLREKISEKSLRRNLMFFCALLVISSVLISVFSDLDHIYGGVYYHGMKYDNPTDYFETNIASTAESIYRASSPHGQVTVFKDNDSDRVWLKNNGKTEASTGDYVTQGLLSHIPMTYHENPKEVLNIGLGGGWSLNSALKYGVDSVDVVEINSKVVEAAGTVLAPYNEHALDDERTNMIIADGRNYLFVTDKKYDVIISEPPNIWISGVSNLFTKEFYEIVRDHLKPNGVFSQWFPRYEMSDGDYRVAIKTLHSVFPYLYEFYSRGDVIVLASMHPIDIYEDADPQLLENPKIARDFSRMRKQADISMNYALIREEGLEYVENYDEELGEYRYFLYDNKTGVYQKIIAEYDETLGEYRFYMYNKMINDHQEFFFIHDESGDYIQVTKTNYEFLIHFYSKTDHDFKSPAYNTTIISTDDLPYLEFSTLRNKYDKFAVK